MTPPMTKRLRTEEDEGFEVYKQYPIHAPLEEMMKLHLNKFRQQEIKIQGKTHAVESLIKHLEDGTTPRSFPNIQFITVSGSYQEEADSLIGAHMRNAYKSVLEVLIDIRLKEKRNEVNNKNLIFQEYTMQLTNALNNYHQAGALEKDELPIWIAKYKEWLTDKATKESKMLKMKRLVQQEKRSTVAEKKKVAQAEADVKDVMDVDGSDAMKQLKAQVAKLMIVSERQTGRRKEPRPHLNPKAQGNKPRPTKRAKGGQNRDLHPHPKKQDKGRKNARGGTGGPGKGKPTRPSHFKRGTTPSGYARKPSPPKRNLS